MAVRPDMASVFVTLQLLCGPPNVAAQCCCARRMASWQQLHDMCLLVAERAAAAAGGYSQARRMAHRQTVQSRACAQLKEAASYAAAKLLVPSTAQPWVMHKHGTALLQRHTGGAVAAARQQATQLLHLMACSQVPDAAQRQVCNAWHAGRDGSYRQTAVTRLLHLVGRGQVPRAAQRQVVHIVARRQGRQLQAGGQKGGGRGVGAVQGHGRLHR